MLEQYYKLPYQNLIKRTGVVLRVVPARIPAIHMGVKFVLTAWEAWLWCGAGSSLFVVSLYLVPPKLRRLRRDDPAQIKARYAAVATTTSLAVLVTRTLARTVDGGFPFGEWIGVRAENLGVASVLPLLLTSALFLGPIATMACMARKRAFNEVTPLGYTRPRTNALPWYTVVGIELAEKANLDQGRYIVIRNLVVGPLAEELVFRGCFAPLLLGAEISLVKIIWLSPLIFGVAHVHHAYEWLRQGHRLKSVMAGVIFQMTYTSLFGAFAMFVHLRTGHLVSSVLVHMLCNFMGVPDLTFSVAPGKPGESSPTSVLRAYRSGLWLCYGAGICIFFSLLVPLTSPSIYNSALWPTPS